MNTGPTAEFMKKFVKGKASDSTKDKARAVGGKKESRLAKAMKGKKK